MALLPWKRMSRVWWVRSGGGEVWVGLRLTRRQLVCPHCEFRTRHRYDTQTEIITVLMD